MIPEPWTISDDGTIEERHAGRVGSLSADVSPGHRAIIAAAPELLDALLRVLRRIPADAGGASLSDDIHRAKQAIARAQGKS